MKVCYITGATGCKQVLLSQRQMQSQILIDDVIVQNCFYSPLYKTFIIKTAFDYSTTPGISVPLSQP